MAKKGENIFLRKDGRWEARYVKGYTSDNKIIYGYVYGKSYLSAKKKKNDILLTINLENINNKKNKDEFSYLINKWLVEKKVSVKETTFSRYQNIIDKYILPSLGSHKTNEINDEIVSQFIVILLLFYIIVLLLSK